MIEMKFIRKNRNFDQGTNVRVISVSSINMGGKKTQAYVNFEYDVTTYDLETGDIVIVQTGIKKNAEHASFFFPNEELRKVEVIMEARDEVDIEKMMDMIKDTTWLDLYEKHKGSIKGKKFGI